MDFIKNAVFTRINDRAPFFTPLSNCLMKQKKKKKKKYATWNYLGLFYSSGFFLMGRCCISPPSPPPTPRFLVMWEFVRLKSSSGFLGNLFGSRMSTRYFGHKDLMTRRDSPEGYRGARGSFIMISVNLCPPEWAKKKKKNPPQGSSFFFEISVNSLV